jgi:hypothetical protein
MACEGTYYVAEDITSFQTRYLYIPTSLQRIVYNTLSSSMLLKFYLGSIRKRLTVKEIVQYIYPVSSAP